MLAQGQSSSAKRGGGVPHIKERKMGTDVSSGLIFFYKKKNLKDE